MTENIMPVDQFIKMNNRMSYFLAGTDYNFDKKSSRRYIPHISMEENSDIYGLDEKDDIAPSIILPRDTSYDYEKAKARRFAQEHKFDLEIIFTCPCDDPFKVKHHPDYSHPGRVTLLCMKMSRAGT